MSENKQDSKQLMIIDTDCGTDDALAIMLALSFKNSWEVLALTCCFGNASVDNVCSNCMRVLHLCDQIQIPIYSGCGRPLVSECTTRTVHGDDGLGNAAHEFSTGNLTISDGHAAVVLSKLVREHPKQVNLAVLGPMTNIALAHRLDPQFTENLKSIYFMGGNIHGIGNTTSAAEYNFGCDPESANIVLTEAKCPLTMIPWETTMEHGISWGYYRYLTELPSPKAYFMKKITKELEALCRSHHGTSYLDCDLLVVASLVCPQSISKFENFPVYVETVGKFTRGQAVVDRLYLRHKQEGSCCTTNNTVKIVTCLDDVILNKLRKKAVEDLMISE